MEETFNIVIGLIVGLVIVVSLLRTLLSDGYGRRPPPRSHWDEVSVTQHEKLGELVR